MKKMFFPCILSLCVISSFGQDLEERIRDNFNAYLGLLESKEFDQSLDYMVDDFFEILSREQMVAVMEQTFNNPELQIELRNPQILEIGEVEEIEEKRYAILTYSNELYMLLNLEDVKRKEKEQVLELTQLSFNENYGAENVQLDSESGAFSICTEKRVCAISEGGDSWKFMAIDSNYKPIYEKFLPKAVLDKI